MALRDCFEKTKKTKNEEPKILSKDIKKKLKLINKAFH
jgi:hypothetical protein